MLLFLFFQCHSCNYFIESYTSRSVGKGFDINTRAVYSMRACGRGYAGLEKFVSLMNLPKPTTSNNYDKIVTKLIAATKEIGETTMQDHNAMQGACEELRGGGGGGGEFYQYRGYISLL